MRSRLLRSGISMFRTEFNTTEGRELKLNSKNGPTTIPMYYINLDRSVNRRKHMENVFSDWGKLTRVAAVDGSNDKEFERFVDLHGMSVKECTERQKATAGQMALVASHVKAIEKAFKANDEVAVIFEDDSSDVLSPFWTFSLEELVGMADGKDANWDIIQLQAVQLKSSYDKWQETTDRLFPLPPRSWGTGAYMIHRRGMQKFVSFFMTKEGKMESQIVKKNTEPFEVDYLLYYLPFVNALVTIPPMFNQMYNEGSTGSRKVMKTDKRESDHLVGHREAYFFSLHSAVEAFEARNAEFQLPHK